jgi:hypothetical protein
MSLGDLVGDDMIILKLILKEIGFKILAWIQGPVGRQITEMLLCFLKG